MKLYNHANHYKVILFVRVLIIKRCIRHLGNQNNHYRRDNKASNKIWTALTTLNDKILYLLLKKQYTQGAVFLSFREFSILSEKGLVHQRNKMETSAYYIKHIVKLHWHLFWHTDNRKSWLMNILVRISEIEIIGPLVRRLNRFDTKKWHKRSIHNNTYYILYFFFSITSYRGFENQNYANLRD